MKRESINLLYHRAHTRPMPGCLPLFVILAALLVVGIAIVFKVNLPPLMEPRGEGNIIYRQDELTRFRVRQLSALPLRLPAAVDPAARSLVPEHKLPLHPTMQLVPPPSQLSPACDHESAILDDAYLLELPPEADPTPTQQDK